MRGLVVKSTGSWYRIRTEKGEYDARLRGKFRNLGLKVTNPIAVGDEVVCEIEDESHSTLVITEILQRENYFIRKSTRKTAHAHILASNLDQVVLVASYRGPRTSRGFIDRFLVATESFGIPTIVVFNKIDVLKEKDLVKAEATRDVYEKLGYSVIQTNATDGTGVDQLIEKLQGKRTLFAGHSGVGKSTLLNAIDPSLELRTGEVSSHTDKGVHTTTHAEIFNINKTTELIDSPGVKEIGLWGMEKTEVSHYFKEMQPLLGQCQFHNCTHDHEPNCEIRDAYMRGDIEESRYVNFLTIINDDGI